MSSSFSFFFDNFDEDDVKWRSVETLLGLKNECVCKNLDLEMIDAAIILPAFE